MIDIPLKRFWLALSIAISAHFLIFLFLPSLLIKKPEQAPPENKSVTITMSYKKPEVIKKPVIKSIPRLVEKKPVPPPKIKKVKKKAPAPKKKIRKKIIAEKKIAVKSPEEIQPTEALPPENPSVLEEKMPDPDPEIIPPIQDSENLSPKTIQKPAQEQKEIQGKSPIETIKFSDPEYKNNPMPVYPKKARKKKYQGLVELLVLISIDGQVSQVKIKTSAGHRILDRQAEKTVKKWTFEPRKSNGQAVEAWVIVPMRFKLY